MNDPTKSELAYLAIKQAVIEQALKPGTRLPEDMLGSHFQVSRTLIREALARLAAEGLVEAGRKRTAMVAQPSREEAQSVFELRHCLEREAVRLAIGRWTPAMGAALEGHVRLEEQAARQQQTAVAGRLAGEFHIKLAQMSGNPLLERFLSELVSRCSLILAVYGQPHSSECAIAEHRQLIEALRGGDEKAAGKLMHDHLHGVQERTLPPAVEAETDLGAVLGRYAGEIARAGAGATPLAPRKAGAAQSSSRPPPLKKARQAAAKPARKPAA